MKPAGKISGCAVEQLIFPERTESIPEPIHRTHLQGGQYLFRELIKHRGAGQKPGIAISATTDENGIQKGILMIGYKNHRAAGNRTTFIHLPPAEIKVKCNRTILF